MKSFLMALILFTVFRSLSLAQDLTVEMASPQIVISNIPVKISFTLNSSDRAMASKDTTLRVVGLYRSTEKGTEMRKIVIQ